MIQMISWIHYLQEHYKGQSGYCQDAANRNPRIAHSFREDGAQWLREYAARPSTRDSAWLQF